MMAKGGVAIVVAAVVERVAETLLSLVRKFRGSPEIPRVKVEQVGPQDPNVVVPVNV